MMSFILVNYNTKQLTKQVIKSIVGSFDNPNNYEIILVDNASVNGSKEFFEDLARENPNFKYIYNDENVGFGKANNIGFKHSKGAYIYILNNDTILHTKDIDKIINEKFKNHEDLGVIATKVQYSDGTLQTNVQSLTVIKTVLLRLLKVGYMVRVNKYLLKIFLKIPKNLLPKVVRSYLENFNAARKEEYVDWASGCSLIFKRELYEKLGGFDENFFMYTEDEDICLRARKMGYKILYTPDICITHFEGASNKNGKINEHLTKIKIDSEFYLFKKHYPEKLNKLKAVYFIVGLLGYPFSKRVRIIFGHFLKIKSKF